MKFTAKKTDNIINIARKLGYIPERRGDRGEFSCQRPLSRAEYPRFHIYITEEENEFIFNLHLDQKKPSYSGTAAHSGEYEGGAVDGEAERIKQILQN